LGLAQDERKLISLGEGIWGRSERFLLDGILIGWGRSWLAGLELLSSGERGHGVDSTYLPGDNVLRGQVFGEVAEELLNPYPFFELVLNGRLGNFCLLLYHRLIPVPL
jgi:hypothetical protein